MIQIVTDWRDLPPELRGAAVAIGAFDGVHRGHQAVIASAREAAKALDAPLAVVSFSPHPRRWFQPDAAPFRLMTPDQMAEVLATNGMLVKRPLLILADTVLIGFKEEQWKGALLTDKHD